MDVLVVSNSQGLVEFPEEFFLKHFPGSRLMKKQNSTEALQAVFNGEIDLMLVDYMLGCGPSGLNILDFTHKFCRYDPAIVFMFERCWKEHNGKKMEEIALELGAGLILERPFSWRKVMNEIVSLANGC
jgi:hypothetical protein